MFSIAHKSIGGDSPAFIIAEIGSNHNQSFSLALEHIDAAASAGVDAVKFQTFKADSHVSKFAEIASYLSDYDDVHELIGSLELNRDWQKSLKEYAESKGVVFFSSPCDIDAVDGLEAIDSPAHKVASFDLPDLNLIEYIAKTKKPILMSTGMADWMDIQRAVDICRQSGNNDIALFQCTSLYPAPSHLSNLNAMKNMAEMFNVVVGYSDHTIGDTIPVAAVAMGAKLIEKHFTLDRTLPGPDHSFAMEPAELKVMVQKIREIESAIGDGVKNGPRKEEVEMFQKGRRSLHAKVDIHEGQVITDDMLVIKRPGYGIPPYLKDQVVSRVAKCNIAADHWLDWSMF